MTKIAIAKGDGIGPEIMDATLNILKTSGAKIEFEEIQIGEQVYLSGNTSGITTSAWDTIRKNKILLKAPITTPRGGGYKSLNVTMRKSLGLFANVRPCRSLYPFVETKHKDLDIVIVRENEEDLYAGIEHRQTDEVYQCLKLITRPGSEKIVRYAFEYAKAYGRKKVSCFVKDNIMKLTDGVFHSVFKEIAKEYPEIESESWIIDIATARIADTPEMFDVVVMPNLYGDIVSDVVAQISGSVGLAGSANIGQEVSMFEAIHGSAPDIAGKNIANPSGLLQASVMMLNQIGQSDKAELISNAWACTLEEGIHTADIYNETGASKQKVGTKEFGEAVAERIGKKPEQIKPASFKNTTISIPKYVRRTPQKKVLKGIDIFADNGQITPDGLAQKLLTIQNELKLVMITNRGVKVWPNGFDETFCTDHWRCRFSIEGEGSANQKSIPELLSNAIEAGIDIIKTENLYEFDGERGYALGQGQ